MQTMAIVSGFSELKDLLIRTYNIERSRAEVRLYFTEDQDQLLMHDYHDHKKLIVLATSISRKELRKSLKGFAAQLCELALSEVEPSKFLNRRFTSDGFFTV